MVVNFIDNEVSSKFLSDKNCAVRTIDMEIETIVKLRDSLDESLSQALDLMQNAKGRIIITGMGRHWRQQGRLRFSFTLPKQATAIWA